MKKEYIKPECVIEEFMPISMLATSREEIGSDDTLGNQNDFNALNRRGNWGNLWEGGIAEKKGYRW